MKPSYLDWPFGTLGAMLSGAIARGGGVSTLIPALRAADARDILEIPVSKIIE